MAKTVMQNLYQKEVRRLKQQLYRMYKQTGIKVDYKIPEMPKRVTQKDINELQRMDFNLQARNKADYLDEETGETYTYEQAKERYQQTGESLTYVPHIDYYANFVDIFLNEIQIYNKWFVTHITAWIKQLVMENSKTAVGKMLYHGRENGLIIDREQTYTYDDMIAYMNEMMDYLGIDYDERAEASEQLEEEAGFPDIE